MEKENKKTIENFREEVKILEEYKLFLYIDELGGVSYRERRGYRKGHLEISEEALNDNLNFYYQMQEIALQEVINRFRVRPRPAEAHIQLSLFDLPPKYPEWNYYRWYRFWSKWRESFSEFWWGIILSKIIDKKDVSRHLPTRDWDDVDGFSEELLRHDACELTEEDVVLYTIEV